MPSNLSAIPKPWICLDCKKVTMFTVREMRSKNRCHCNHCGGIVFTVCKESARAVEKRLSRLNTKLPPRGKNHPYALRAAGSPTPKSARNTTRQLKQWHQNHKAKQVEKRRLERLAYPSTVEVSTIFPAAQPSHIQADSTSLPESS